MISAEKREVKLFTIAEIPALERIYKSISSNPKSVMVKMATSWASIIYHDYAVSSLYLFYQQPFFGHARK